MKKAFISSAVAALLLATAVTAIAQTTIEFNSMNRKQGFPAILEHRAQYTDKISGVFTRPANATGNVPVMVIMHSSGGINETTWEWSKFFLDMGVATFVVDSFKPRGILDTNSDQAQLSNFASAADALMALKTVAEQPGIDINRIGVIGFSRGALASAASSIEKVRSGVLGKESTLKFALHVPYYGGCTYVGKTTGAPLMFFIGDKDDYFSVESCTRTVAGLRSKGATIEGYTIYPGALHGFDVSRDRNVYVAQAQAFKGCDVAQDLDDSAYFAEGKQVTSKEYGDYFGKCTTRGTTVGLNYAAKTDSRAKTKAFVLKTFGL